MSTVPGPERAATSALAQAPARAEPSVPGAAARGADAPAASAKVTPATARPAPAPATAGDTATGARRPHLGPETPPPAFADPAIDTVVAMLLELAQELWVTRARLAALEAQAGPVPALTPEAEAELAAARAEFVRRLFAPVERL